LTKGVDRFWKFSSQVLKQLAYDLCCCVRLTKKLDPTFGHRLAVRAKMVVDLYYLHV
jgi:hypothetical protein